MQINTRLSVMDFRQRFAHRVSPDWAVGSHVNKDGYCLSGRTTAERFELRVSKGAIHPLLPYADGVITPTEEGCSLSWKIRRKPVAYIALAVGVLSSAGLLYFFGSLTIMALYACFNGHPEMWSMAAPMLLFSLLVLTGAVICAVLLLFVPKRSRTRIENELFRIVGKEHLVEEE